MYYMFALNMDWAHEASKLMITALMRYKEGLAYIPWARLHKTCT